MTANEYISSTYKQREDWIFTASSAELQAVSDELAKMAKALPDTAENFTTRKKWNGMAQTLGKWGWAGQAEREGR